MRYWLSLAVLAAACSSDGQAPMPDADTSHFEQNFSPNQMLPLDLLLVLDDSSSMTTVQQNLVAGFPVFINILTSLPVRPQMHLAVTTTSMGAGAFTANVPGCQAPDLGRFVDTPRSPQDPTACSTNHLNTGEHFFVDEDAGTTKNYVGDLATAFGCVASVGSNGCEFEQPMAAARAALGDPTMGVQAPPENAGFLRDDAVLGVMLITNEDDCSVPPNSELFDPNQNSPSDPLGPLSSFRCTEFGILCGGQPPPRQAAGPLANCGSNDGAAVTDPQHSLVPLQFYVDYFRRVKSDPNRVITAVVAGPADPFAVVIDQQTGFPSLQHSCQATNGTFGDPAVRLAGLVSAFGRAGVNNSICENSWADVWGMIANTIGRQLPNDCIANVLGDVQSGFSTPLLPAQDAVADPSRYSCTVEDIQHFGTPQQTLLDTLGPCQPAGQATGQCYAVIGDSKCTVSGVKLAICRNGFDPSNSFMPCPMGGSVADSVTTVLTCRTVH